jgi:hypothetical protein
VERYPELKTKNFLKLQDELASTENQILTARTRFNGETIQQSYQNIPKLDLGYVRLGKTIFQAVC